MTGVDGKVLTDQPMNIYAALGNTALNVDKLVVGFNTMDGVIGFPYHAGPRPTTEHEYKEFLAEYVSNATQVDLLSTHYYPPSDFPAYPPDHNPYELAWFTITSDCCLSCPSLLLGDQVESQAGADVAFVYYFGGPGKNGSYYAPHASEVSFVCDDARSSEGFDMPWDQSLANEMVSAWTNFAKYGEPNVTDSTDGVEVEWPYYGGAGESNVVVFEDSVRVVSSFAGEYRRNVCDFWYNQVGNETMAYICFDGSFANVTNMTHTV